LCILIKTQTIRQATLGKTERVKKRKVIEQLFSAGKTFSVYPLRAYYLFSSQQSEEGNEGSPLQFGAGVSKRHFKKAVHRNRIKRLLRETYRLQKLPLQNCITEKKNCLYVFVIFTGKELPLFEALKPIMANLLARLEKEAAKQL